MSPWATIFGDIEKILQGKLIKIPENRTIKPTIRRKKFKPPKSYELVEKEILQRKEEKDRRLLEQIRKSEERIRVREERAQYNIATKIELVDGSLQVTCPSCGRSSRLGSKTSPIRCPQCNNDYIVPKKFLDIL